MKPDLHNEIAKVAYDLYLKEGCRDGWALVHWLEAEKIVEKRYTTEPDDAPADDLPPASLPEKGARKNRPGSRRQKSAGKAGRGLLRT